MIAIGDLIAGLALVLSGLSLLWQWRDKRPRLIVSANVTPESLPTADPLNPHKATPVLSIYLSNPGRVPIYVRDLRFKLAKGKEFPLFEYHALYSQIFQPFVVDPLRGRKFVVNTENFIKNHEEILGYSENIVGYVRVRDEVGKYFKSKRVQFPVSDLSPAETGTTQPVP